MTPRESSPLPGGKLPQDGKRKDTILSLLSFVLKLAESDTKAIAKQVERDALKTIEVKHKVIETAKEVQEQWRDMIPESNAPAHVLRKGSIYVYEPGDAKRSIRVKYTENDGEFSAKVGSKNPVLRWLEYGTKNFAERGYAARIVEEHGGHDGEIHV